MPDKIAERVSDRAAIFLIVDRRLQKDSDRYRCSRMCDRLRSGLGWWQRRRSKRGLDLFLRNMFIDARLGWSLLGGRRLAWRRRCAFRLRTLGKLRFRPTARL